MLQTIGVTFAEIYHSMKIKSTKLLTFLILVLFGLGSNSIMAQVSLIDSVSNLQTCNGPQRMKLNFSGVTGPAAATRTVDVLLPAGNEMGSLVSSSVTGGGAVALQRDGAALDAALGGGPRHRALPVRQLRRHGAGQLALGRGVGRAGPAGGLRRRGRHPDRPDCYRRAPSGRPPA